MTPIGQKNWHLLNHCSTGVLFPAIKNIAQKYHDEFYCYEDCEPIGNNDRALPHGGVFDTNNNWRESHYSYHRGKAVDIRYKPGRSNSVIHTTDNRIFNRSLEICDEHGLRTSEHVLEDKPAEHCHCCISKSGEGKITPQSTQASSLRRSQQ